jgi:hypothetical protein
VLRLAPELSCTVAAEYRGNLGSLAYELFDLHHQHYTIPHYFRRRGYTNPDYKLSEDDTSVINPFKGISNFKVCREHVPAVYKALNRSIYHEPLGTDGQDDLGKLGAPCLVDILRAAVVRRIDPDIVWKNEPLGTSRIEEYFAADSNRPLSEGFDQLGSMVPLHIIETLAFTWFCPCKRMNANSDRRGNEKFVYHLPVRLYRGNTVAQLCTGCQARTNAD